MKKYINCKIQYLQDNIKRKGQAIVGRDSLYIRSVVFRLINVVLLILGLVYKLQRLGILVAFETYSRIERCRAIVKHDIRTCNSVFGNYYLNLLNYSSTRSTVKNIRRITGKKFIKINFQLFLEIFLCQSPISVM